VIRVMSLCELEAETIDHVTKRLYIAFGVGVRLLNERTETGLVAERLPADAFEAKGNAYDAMKLLAHAPKVPGVLDDKVLFIMDRPLTLPLGPMGKGPVDGFADDDRRRAVVTSHGLSGGETFPQLLAKRAIRHAGHLHGLHHCHDARCSMLPGWREGFDANPDLAVPLCVFCRETSDKTIQRA